MSKFTLSVALSVVLAFILAASDNAVSARSTKGSPHGGMRTMQHNGHSYHTHFYRSSYRGWSSYCWYSRYRCYGYYCPTQSCWYYWYPQSSCYLPCSNLTTFMPTPLNANQNANQNTNVNNNISVAAGPTPALPVGATAVPPGAGPFIPPLPK